MKFLMLVLALVVLAICGDIANAAKRNKSSKGKSLVVKGKKCGRRVMCGGKCCKRRQVCLTVDGETACGCRLKCPSRVRPVCGNDDVTYNNHCELNRAACIAGRRIRKKFKGTCEGGPVKNAGKSRQKRPKSKRPRPAKRPGRRTRGHNRLSPTHGQALPAKTRPSSAHVQLNQTRQNTRMTAMETKTATSLNQMSTRKTTLRPVAAGGATSVKTGPRTTQGLASRHSPMTRSWQSVAVSRQAVAVQQQSMAVPQRAVSGPRRTWIGPERKPLACYQLERDQLRLLLVAWMKSQADRTAAQSGVSTEQAYDTVLLHHFRACDTNRDGALKSKEMLSCMEKHTSDRSSPATRAKVLRGLCVDALIVMADENEDWRLSFDEFRKSMDPKLRTPNKPCSLEGKEYKDGAQTSVNCNRCVCACGSWVCTETVCARSTGHDVDHKYIIKQALLPSKRDRRALLEGFKASNTINVHLIEDITKN